MNNVGDVGYCIAGVKRVEVINERESQWKIEQRIGFMARTFDLRAKISELEPPNRIAFVASGQDVEIEGDVTFTRVEPALTNCVVAVEVEIVGALAPLVDVFAKGSQQALMRQTVSNLRATLDGATLPAPSGEAGRFSFERLRAWLRLRFRRRNRASTAP